MRETFDLIVIGAGPGGYELAAEAASEGLSTVLFERDLPGGTCLNRGCIPTKALCRSAEAARTAREAAAFGITTGEVAVDFPAVMARKDRIVEGLRAGVETLLAGVTVVRSEAHFAAADTVECDGISYTAPRIVVATGSRPSRLPIAGAEHALTSDELLALTAVPDSLVIIGGGVIGMEFAGVFASLGSKVTVVEYCQEILPNFDAEVAKRLRMALKRQGIDIVTGAAVSSIAPDLTVSYTLRGKEKSVKGAAVLMATGRVPVIPDGLVEAGATLRRSALAVCPDTYKIVWAEGKVPADTEVYAVGDVNGICMLAHAATAQALSILGKSQNRDVVPGVVFTTPEVAMVGLTEQQASEAGIAFRVLRSTFAANGKAAAMGETAGMVKLIVEETTDLLVGAHICGPHAADLIQECAVLIANGLPHSALAHTVHPHPTLSEAIPAAK